MKKTLLLILVFSLVLAQSVFGDDLIEQQKEEVEQNEKGVIIRDVDDAKDVDFSKANSIYLKKGLIKNKNKTDEGVMRITPGLVEDIALSIPHYLQAGQSWSGVKLDPYDPNFLNETIGSHGCTVTSFAMISSYLKNTIIYPNHVVSKLGVSSIDPKISYSSPFEYNLAATKYNLVLSGNVHTSTSVSGSYAKQYIRGALRTGKPVMVGMKHPNTTHFIVAYGYRLYSDGSEQILIKDPSGYSYIYLDQYLNNGYSVNRLKVYSQ